MNMPSATATPVPMPIHSHKLEPVDAAGDELLFAGFAGVVEGSASSLFVFEG